MHSSWRHPGDHNFDDFSVWNPCWGHYKRNLGNWLLSGRFLFDQCTNSLYRFIFGGGGGYKLVINELLIVFSLIMWFRRRLADIRI